MKIVLIDPPYAFSEIGGLKQGFKHVLNKIPSLGLGYLAAVAQERGNVVKIIDCSIVLRSPEEIADTVREFNPEIIGITATTPTFSNAVYIASVLREALPKAVFICGGPHATASPEDSIKTGVFDFLVLGEGEETFLELICRIGAKQGYAASDISGIVFRDNGKIVFGPRRLRIANLDSLPFPARHLFPPPRFYSPTPASYRRLPLAVLMTSRGCPSNCTFCDRAVFGEQFRQRSVTNIMAEVEEVISRYGAKEIRFFDDTFTANAEFVKDICAGIKRLKPRIPWTCLTKVNAVNFEMLAMMRDAGCWQVLFGLESGDDQVLRHLGKNNTVIQNKEAVLLAKKAGLSVRADFLVGSPWETRETFRKTIEFAKSLPLDFAHFNKFVPYPGTKIHNDLVANGRHFDFDKGSYINNHSDFVYFPEKINKQEYAEFLNSAYKEFYLRPGYILRKTFSLRTASELMGQIKGLLSILSL